MQIEAPRERSRFGNFILAAFLVAQVLDGVLTYIGVQMFGRGMEANPLLSTLMYMIGPGPTLAGAKIVAGTCALALHMASVHSVLAVLALVSYLFAVLPWAHMIFVMAAP
jgi:hypothetical protein